jgi:hypothetical protein
VCRAPGAGKTPAHRQASECERSVGKGSRDAGRQRRALWLCVVGTLTLPGSANAAKAHDRTLPIAMLAGHSMGAWVTDLWVHGRWAVCVMGGACNAYLVDAIVLLGDPWRLREVQFISVEGPKDAKGHGVQAQPPL